MVVAPRTAEMKPSKLASLSALPTNGADAYDMEARLEDKKDEVEEEEMVSSMTATKGVN